MADELTMAAVSLRNWEQMAPARRNTWLAITKWQLSKAGSAECFNAAEDVDTAIDAELNATIVHTTEQVQEQHAMEEDERDPSR